MELETVVALTEGLPHTQPRYGRYLYDHVRRHRPAEVLELGFLHGVSSCYLAAALEANGAGTLLTIDRVANRDRTPSIEDLVGRAGLAHRVRAVWAQQSYNWELRRLIEEASPDGRCRPRFDLCFVDGAHTWETDGLAFFLVDKLLRPGGWIVFDDVDWSYGRSKARGRPEREALVASLPEDERDTAQVGSVVDLLVRQHPDYDEISYTGPWRWAWAHKRACVVSAPG